MIGPGLASLFLVSLGLAGCFYVNAASFVAVLVALVLMRRDEFRPMRTVAREKGQIRLGLRYVAGEPLLRLVLIAVTIVGIFAYNFSVTLPLLARVTFHARSAADYGVLMATMGLGAVGGGLAVARRARPTLSLLAALSACLALTMVVVACTPTLSAAAIALVPMGGCTIALVSTANALLQTNSRPEMRGRVMSLYAIAFLGTTPIGSPLVGLVVAWSSPRVAIVMGALSAALVAVMTWSRRRRVMTVPAGAVS
jgi:predicted MFS family arabinose efflux permease